MLLTRVAGWAEEDLYLRLGVDLPSMPRYSPTRIFPHALMVTNCIQTGCQNIAGFFNCHAGGNGGREQQHAVPNTTKRISHRGGKVRSFPSSRTSVPRCVTNPDECMPRPQSLSEELFSWRNHSARVADTDEEGMTVSSTMPEEIASVSSEVLSEDSQFTSPNDNIRSWRQRQPATLRHFAPTAKERKPDIARNEFITVGIGLILLFLFTYLIQYCARHGYIHAPEHNNVYPNSHEEL